MPGWGEVSPLSHLGEIVNVYCGFGQSGATMAFGSIFRAHALGSDQLWCCAYLGDTWQLLSAFRVGEQS